VVANPTVLAAEQTVTVTVIAIENAIPTAPHVHLLDATPETLEIHETHEIAVPHPEILTSQQLRHALASGHQIRTGVDQEALVAISGKARAGKTGADRLHQELTLREETNIEGMTEVETTDTGQGHHCVGRGLRRRSSAAETSHS